MRYEPLIQVDYAFDDFDDLQVLWAHLAISAIQAGYHPREVMIGYA
tara:strand:+ start:739 stop:876 length:138 start_codon:yes stop_codon:yes gene_type:complete